jgi:hypothetical protein
MLFTLCTIRSRALDTCKRALAIALLAATSSGCATLRLNMLKTSSQRSGQVAAYFTIERITNRQGIGGLTAERFSVYENGTPIPAVQAGTTLLEANTAAAHYTMLLIDASGTAVRTGALAAIAEGVQGLIERVGTLQRITVYAYDGAATLVSLTPNGPQPASNLTGLSASIAALQPRDSSTNLNGAVVIGIQQLDRDLAAAPQELKFGTILVVSASRDLANRLPLTAVNDTVQSVTHRVYAIGIGRDADPVVVRTIGRAQNWYDPDLTHTRSLFELAADQIAAQGARHYFLSYCSPARADRRRVRIEANTVDGATGSAEFDIDATLFREGCRATDAPEWARPAAGSASPDLLPTSGESAPQNPTQTPAAPAGSSGASSTPTR